MRYALIKNNIIENIIVADYTMANMIGNQDGYDEVINCDNYPVSVEDIYEDGSFLTSKDYVDEEGRVLIPKRAVIQRDTTSEEKYSMLKAENTNMQEIIDQLLIDCLMGGE